MAHMIPDTLPEYGPGKKAESALYEALQSQLPDDFFIYHGLRYLETEKAAEGEIDFLILHREHGLLAVECKGTGVRRTGTGQWFRILDDGKEWPLKEDPIQQVQRVLKMLVKELDSRAREVLPHLQGTFPFIHGYTVAFPLSLSKEVNLPLNVQPRFVFDASDMTRIHERVVDAFAFWRADRSVPSPLQDHDFKRFRKRVLHPNLHMTESLGAQIQLNAERFVRLSEEQVLFLKGIVNSPRMRVSGGAGTGKTTLALEAARLLADQGKRTLLMCYNQGLAKFLSRTVQDWESGTGTVDVCTFHALCRQAYQALDVPFVVPGGEDPEAAANFWNEGAPLALMEALEKKKISPWDGIVIDEGQDFAGDWWAVIDECLVNREAGHLIVFYDPAQEIFGRGINIPEYGPELPLRCNFRNTRMIFDAMQKIVPVDMDPHPRCPEGREVKRHLQKSRRKAQEEMERLVRAYIEDGRIRPEQITILTPHTRENSLLAGRESIADHPLAADPTDRQGAILHTTIGKFKGLESDILIFADIDPEDERCNTNARYVAISRGRQVLHEFWKREW